MRLRLIACAIIFNVALLLLGSWAAHADPVYQSSTIACVKAKTYSGSAATTVLVTSVPGQQIYVCGFDFGMGTSASAGLEYGATGTTCGTPTAITPVFAQQIVDHQTYYAGITPVPSGSDLCIVTTGTTQDIVYYAQF